jgi:hypothetical protein
MTIGKLPVTTVGSNVIIAGAADGIVNVYDASTDEWSTATSSALHEEAGATTVGNQAVFAGGYTDAGGTSDAIDVYTDEAPSAVLSGGVAGQGGGTVSVVLKNTGDARVAKGYTIQVYAVPPGQYHGAILLGSQFVEGGVAEGATTDYEIPIAIPAGTAAGRYHLVAMLKIGDAVLIPFAGATQDFTISDSNAAKAANAVVRPTFSTNAMTTVSPHDAWLADAAGILA